jgi:hypothetical protein
MNNFIKPQIIDLSKKIEELEQMLLEHSGYLEEAHTLNAEIESNIDIVKKNTQKEPTDLLEMKDQLAFGGFLNICMMDLMVSSKNLIQAKQIWEEIYHVRHIYLTIYEAINTYNGYNKWIKETIENKSLNLQPAFEVLSNRLKKFKKDFEYDKTIAVIRNQTTAHITTNFIDFFQNISSIDIDRGKLALKEFVKILNMMQKLVRDIGWLKVQEMLTKSHTTGGV